MVATIRHMDAANLFVGDDDPENSQFLVLKNIKFPNLEEIKKEHLGGGAIGKISMGMRALEALTMTFSLEGFTEDVLDRFMSPVGRLKYTLRGNIRDLQTLADIEVKAVLEGRMTKAEISEFEHEKGIDTSYEITEATFYTLHYGSQEKVFFNYFKSRLRINAVDVLRQRNINLGIGV